MSRRRPRRLRERIVYQPGTSWLHRLHPVVKLAWLLGGTVLLFLVDNPWAVAAAVLMLAICFPLAGLRLGRVRGVRMFVVTAVLLGLLQMVFVQDGAQLWSLGPLAITAAGLRGAVYIAGRFLGAVLLSYLFVLSTELNDLAYGLMRVGLPYRYGFALVTALRLVPTFEHEGQIVYQAQLARGVQYDVRSPRRLLVLGRQFFLPLLVSALGKVDVLAVSMEGRCFGKQPQRTFLREVRSSWRDGLALAVLLLAVAGTVAIRLVR